MTDLAGRMRALRDQQGLQLADALLRQTAKDPSATLTTLDRRFRMSGLPQTLEVLRQLISLRDAAAQQAGDEAGPPVEPVSSPAPASAVAEAPHVEQVESWSGPPDWYRRAAESPDTGPRPQVRPAAEPTATPMTPPPAAVAESPTHRSQVLTGPPSWYTEPEVDTPPHPARSGPRHAVGPQTQDPSPEPVAVVSAQSPPSAADLTDVALLSGQCDVFDNRDGRMRLRVDNGRLILHWNTPADIPPHTTVVYLVSASPTVVPETPDDGQRVAATLDNQLIVPVDPTHFFFSVFAYSVVNVGELATATSFRHAIGRLLPEVEDLHVRAEEHGVLLSWIRPVRAERVRVMRSRPNEPLPSGPDPSLQVTFSGDSFRDRDAEPGMTYQYRIYTESQALGGGDGAVEFSPGIERTVTVPGRPTPVDRLDARVVPRSQRPGIEVSWNPPARGKVHIYLRGGELDPDIVVGVPQSREQFDLQARLLGDRVREPIVTVGDLDSMEWVPLDTQADDGRQARWTLTAVTEFAGTLIIGAHQVVVYVGDVEEVAIEERVDWQLLRSTWPSGATFLGIWTLPPGETASGGPHQMITRDQFDACGGVGLKLQAEAQDIVVQGATKYGPKWVNGGAARVAYPGRWVLRYQLQATGRMGGSRVLHLGVERPDWSDLSLLLATSEHGFPLTSQAPGVAPIYQGQLPGKSLVPNTFVPASPEFKAPRDLTTRLFAWSSGGIVPIVVDPLDPPFAPPTQLPPPPMRCPRCLIPSDLTVQYFRCEGVCPDEPDIELTELFEPGVANPAKVRSGKLVFQVPRPVISERNVQHLGPPTNAAPCPRTNCRRVSRQQVCGHCHSPLPPNWWAHEVLGVVMVGARSTGKTTYLSVLVRHLERTLLPSTGGHLHPVDAASELKLAAMREGLRSGKLEPGTLSARQNDTLLEPMLANIGAAPDGRIRSIALFDVAGEDMSTAEGVRPYSPALASADLVLILIDPLQLDGIREWLDGTVPLPLQGAPSVTVVNNVVEQVRRQRGIPAGPLPIRAAVAFAKFDGLQEAAKMRQSSVGSLIGPGNALWRDPYLFSGEVYSDPDGRRVHDEVRALLLRVGESALVASVEASFRDVQYFAVSALGHGPRGRQVSAAGASPQRVGDPIRWLLWANGWTGR